MDKLHRELFEEFKKLHEVANASIVGTKVEVRPSMSETKTYGDRVTASMQAWDAAGDEARLAGHRTSSRSVWQDPQVTPVGVVDETQLSHLREKVARLVARRDRLLAESAGSPPETRARVADTLRELSSQMEALMGQADALISAARRAPPTTTTLLTIHEPTLARMKSLRDKHIQAQREWAERIYGQHLGDEYWRVRAARDELSDAMGDMKFDRRKLESEAANGKK